MKILVLAPNIPATSRMPGSPRLFSLSRELSRNHDLVLASFCSSPDRYRAFSTDPTNQYVFKRVELLPPPPPLTWWGQQWHRAHLAAYFETRYRHPKYYRAIQEKVLEICAEEKVDLVHADLLEMAQYVPASLTIPAIVDITDSMTLLGTRVLATAEGARKKLSAYLALLRAKKLERSLGQVFDLIITNSPVDEEVIQRLSVTSRTTTISNGIDTGFFSTNHHAVESDKIVFTGVMGYPPNEDAALYFAQDIFPIIRAHHSTAQFWIVGSGPSQRVRDLAHCPGIYVTGEVEDVRPFVQSAAVVVCPLRVGSGVKNKILVAMAMQKATVATSLSIEGLDLADNREVLLADNPPAFAKRVLHLLGHPEEALRLGSNALKRVQERYSWSSMGQALESAMQSIVTSERP